MDYEKVVNMRAGMGNDRRKKTQKDVQFKSHQWCEYAWMKWVKNCMSAKTNDTGHACIWYILFVIYIFRV